MEPRQTERLEATRRRLVEQLQVLVRRESALERHLRGQDDRISAGRLDALPGTACCMACAAAEGAA